MREFAFKIGDVVVTKATLAQMEAFAAAGVACVPRFLTVVGRTREERLAGEELAYVATDGGPDEVYREAELLGRDAFRPAEVLHTVAKARRDYPTVCGDAQGKG